MQMIYIMIKDWQNYLSVMLLTNNNISFKVNLFLYRLYSMIPDSAWEVNGIRYESVW